MASGAIFAKNGSGRTRTGAARQTAVQNNAAEPATRTTSDLTIKTRDDPTYPIYYTLIVARHLRLFWVLLTLLIASLQAAELRLIDAVKNTEAKTVRLLLQQHADVNTTEADGFTALHWAAQRDNLEIADFSSWPQVPMSKPPRATTSLPFRWPAPMAMRR